MERIEEPERLREENARRPVGHRTISDFSNLGASANIPPPPKHDRKQLRRFEYYMLVATKSMTLEEKHTETRSLGKQEKSLQAYTISAYDLICFDWKKMGNRGPEIISGTIYEASNIIYLPKVPKPLDSDSAEKLYSELNGEEFFKLDYFQFDTLVPRTKSERQRCLKEIREYKWVAPLRPEIPTYVNERNTGIEACLVAEEIKHITVPKLEKGMLLLKKKKALYDAVTLTKLTEENISSLEKHPSLWRIPQCLCAFLKECTDRVAVCSSGQLFIAACALNEEVVKVSVVLEGRPATPGTVLNAEDGLLWVQIDGEPEARRMCVENLFDVNTTPTWYLSRVDRFTNFCRGDPVQVEGSGALGVFDAVLSIPEESTPLAVVRLFVADTTDDAVVVPRHLGPFLTQLQLGPVTVCSVDVLKKCDLFITVSQFVGLDNMAVPIGCLVALTSDNNLWTIDPRMLIGRIFPGRLTKNLRQISVQQLMRLLPIPAQNRVASLEESGAQNTFSLPHRRSFKTKLGRKYAPPSMDESTKKNPPQWISDALSADGDVSGFKKGQLVELRFRLDGQEPRPSFGFVKTILQPPMEKSSFLVAESVSTLISRPPIPTCLQPYMQHLPLREDRALICDLQSVKHCTAYLLMKAHSQELPLGVFLARNRDGDLYVMKSRHCLGVCYDIERKFSVMEIAAPILPFLLAIKSRDLRVAFWQNGHFDRILGSPLPLKNVLLCPLDPGDRPNPGAVGTVTRFGNGHARIRIHDKEYQATLEELYCLEDGLPSATNENSGQEFFPGDIVSVDGGKLMGRLRAFVQIPWLKHPVGVLIMTTQKMAGQMEVFLVSHLTFIARPEEEKEKAPSTPFARISSTIRHKGADNEAAGPADHDDLMEVHSTRRVPYVGAEHVDRKASSRPADIRRSNSSSPSYIRRSNSSRPADIRRSHSPKPADIRRTNSSRPADIRRSHSPKPAAISPPNLPPFIIENFAEFPLNARVRFPAETTGDELIGRLAWTGRAGASGKALAVVVLDAAHPEGTNGVFSGMELVTRCEAGRALLVPVDRLRVDLIQLDSVDDPEKILSKNNSASPAVGQEMLKSPNSDERKSSKDAEDKKLCNSLVAEDENEALPEWQGNIAWICSSERGIYGHPGSSALDSLLFALFAFSHVLERKVLRRRCCSPLEERAGKVLLDEIVYPLRKDNEVSCEGVQALVELLDKVDEVGKQNGRDLLKSAFVLFERVLGLEPLLHVGSGAQYQGSFFFQLAVPDTQLLVTSSHCLEFSVMQNNIHFKEVPDVLMLVIPQDSKVVPSKVLDLRCCLRGVRDLARCALCGASPVSHSDRRLFASGGLRAALLCSCCAEFCPKDQLQALPASDGRKEFSEPPDLRLSAVICRQQDRCSAFVSAKGQLWVHFDSMAKEEDDVFFPDIAKAEVDIWLSRALVTQSIDSDFCEAERKPRHELLFSAARVLIYEKAKEE